MRKWGHPTSVRGVHGNGTRLDPNGLKLKNDLTPMGSFSNYSCLLYRVETDATGRRIMSTNNKAFSASAMRMRGILVWVLLPAVKIKL